MPPSGYSSGQTNHLTRFLHACSEALLEEAAQKGLTLRATLDGEIANIEHHLDTASSSPAQHASLELTRAFYEAVRDRAPGDTVEFRIAVLEATARLETEILQVKVVEIA